MGWERLVTTSAAPAVPIVPRRAALPSAPPARPRRPVAAASPLATRTASAVPARLFEAVAWVSVVAGEAGERLWSLLLAGARGAVRALDRRGKARTEGWLAFGLVAASIVVLAGAGITWIVAPFGTTHHPKITVAPARNVGVVPVGPRVAPAAATVAPDRIEIPKLDAVAPIVNVSTLPNDELEVPLNPKVVGWWQWGAKPGAAKGTAILDGHINYAGVEGVLSRIGTLNPGDQVKVFGSGGGKEREITFTVTGVRTYNKQVLPYAQIFDQNSTGRLAIVTCGGPFDASTGNYEDNIVAFAVPVSVSEPLDLQAD